MPLQNRVDPFGTLFRTPARGTFMGNRGGAIHNADREIVRAFKSRRWITCVLEFRGRHRTVMSQNRYTELFFLDEAVAFAAGHRPCAECRRERFNAFKKAWQSRNGAERNTWIGADEIDAELHRHRINKQRSKITYEDALDQLPNGVFIQLEEKPYLVLDDALLLWTPERYANKIHKPPGLTVTVLTPRPIVECFRQGYQPKIHQSAGSFPF
jgi:hypothetical protein